ncbi:thioester reductase domain-containing protein [Actinophytocola sp.]|uniref:thioester reductase domain-containing protein n=1 Tax=Actinophytocola sp. TaxID=1872138 RepID=UPI002ED341D7
MSAETDIAVVGVGCRFPDAWTPAEFWRNIDAGAVAMRELTDEQLAAAGVPEETRAAPDFVRVATTLPGAADFAADFFGYPAQEAETVDPQQRIFLETCWEALESAGHAAGAGVPTVGVFAGGAESTYRAAVLVAKAAEGGVIAAVDDLDLHLGGLGDFLTSRVAYKLGLRGPSVSVQTACSSSLYAVHYATLSLLSGECDIALAGGSTVLEPLAGYRYQPGGLQSADGFCRSFDATSTGTSFGSGVGAVALRRLADALADGDPILAVLKGSAVGNDGAARQGFSAPSPAGVADVVSAALRVSDVSPDQLRYVEAHGSGTALGDHVELLGLTRGLAGSTRTGYCGLGSVKANIGHCGPTAGIAGFIKAVNAVRTGVLPPHPRFQRPRDPGILAESPFVIDTVARVSADDDRHVLVNSMGMGGTNVAAVLAPPPAPTRAPAPARGTVRLVVSARTRSELDTVSRQLADELDRGTTPVADIAHTLRVGRQSFMDRRVVAAPADRLADALRLPRAPLARTVRATPRRAVIVPSPDGDMPGIVAALRAALPAGTEVMTGTSLPANAFPILVGHGEPGPHRHVVPADGPVSDLVDEALTAAWLHGVEITWASPVGRRVVLPTYPFTRRRYWALDRLTPIAAVPAPPEPAVDEAPAEPGSLEDDLTALWRSLFGVESVGMDDEFGRLGGTSLLAVRMALEVQQRHGVLVNVHRAGGTRTTVRRLAEIVRGKLAGAERGSADIDPIADGDGHLVDADTQLPLGPLAPDEAPGTDVLLTGATGFLGAFVLHELLNATDGRVYCLVRAGTEEEGWERLRTVAEKFLLPEPDRDRVHLVLGDLRNIDEMSARYGELATRIGSVVHAAAKVVFTEPYRVLRDDNVLPMVELLKWMRGNGIRDFSFVSTVAATAPAMGAGGRVLETREQPLDPQQGGYGVSKWVGERLLERAEADGMRIRVFRPGFVLASGRTGACNDKDLIWHIMASGLAVGAHPLDDRGNPMAGVDLVARAIAELSGSPGSVGRVYHLVDQRAPGLRSVFGLLADAGLATEAASPEKWLARVSEEALASGDEVLSNMALYELEGHELGEHDMEADAWLPWLRRNGLDSAPTGELLRAGLTYLADRHSPVGELLSELMGVRS